MEHSRRCETWKTGGRENYLVTVAVAADVVVVRVLGGITLIPPYESR